MRTFSKLSLSIFLTIILLAGTSCVPPHPPLPPSPGKVIRKLHRYHYFPGAQVYYQPARRVYFYLDGGVWLSAPLLPPHIHVDVDHFVDIEIEGPRPYAYHRDHLKRYPPGLRKEKHSRQREKWDAKQEKKREKVRKKERRERDHDDDRYEKQRRRDDDDDKDSRGRGKKRRYDDDDDYRNKGWKKEGNRVWK